MKCDTEAIRFGLIADPQYADLADEPLKSFYPSSALGKLANAATMLQLESVEFLFLLGDWVQGSRREHPTRTRRELNQVRRALGAYHGEIHAVLGNHDLVDMEKEDALRLMDAVESRAAYSFGREGVRFIVLDTNFTLDGMPYGLSTPFDWSDSFLPDSEMAWLEKELSAAEEDFIFLCVHQNLQPSAGAHGLGNAKDVRALLEASKKVRAVFQGHLHEGGLWVHGGIAYLTPKAMVSCAGESNAWCEVSFSRHTGRLEVRGRGGAQPSYSLPLIADR